MVLRSSIEGFCVRSFFCYWIFENTSFRNHSVTPSMGANGAAHGGASVVKDTGSSRGSVWPWQTREAPRYGTAARHRHRAVHRDDRSAPSAPRACTLVDFSDKAGGSDSAGKR